MIHWSMWHVHVRQLVRVLQQMSVMSTMCAGLLRCMAQLSRLRRGAVVLRRHIAKSLGDIGIYIMYITETYNRYLPLIIIPPSVEPWDAAIYLLTGVF